MKYTFLCRCDGIEGIQCEQKEGRGEFIAKEPKLLNPVSKDLSSQVSANRTYVKGIVLLELHRFFGFAHDDQDRRGATENRVPAAFVGFPC